MQDRLMFEERELKPYAEPVNTCALREGKTYFFLSFADDDLLVPHLDPLVFVGRDLSPGDVNQVYFQDLDSYRRGFRFDGSTGDNSAVFQCWDESSVGQVIEFERAPDLLLTCSIRRRKAGP